MPLISSAVIDSLMTESYAVVDLSSEIRSLIRCIYNQGECFFQQPVDKKIESATSSCLEGFRHFGAEYSESPDRVDLNESFSVWNRNIGRKEVMAWAANSDLHQVMARLLAPYYDLAEQTLEALRCRIAPDSQPIIPSEYSYIQLNYYAPPSQRSRPILMDRHEDGHLLTIGCSNSPGLEFEIDGHFQSINLHSNQAVVWAGSVLTALTGGLIKPIYHRVIRHDLAFARQSINFFVNSSLQRGQRPWIENSSNRGVDIAELTISKSASFGLSDLENIP